MTPIASEMIHEVGNSCLHIEDIPVVHTAWFSANTVVLLVLHRARSNTSIDLKNLVLELQLRPMY